MKALTTPLTFACILALAACGADERADDAAPSTPEPAAEVMSPQDAIGGSHIPTLDPERMNEAEITRALGEGPKCSFHYTSDGETVFAFSRTGDQPTGVLRLTGDLIVLQGTRDGNALRFEAAPVRMSLSPQAGNEENSHNGLEEAQAMFEIGDELQVGYRGYYGCDAAPSG